MNNIIVVGIDVNEGLARMVYGPPEGDGLYVLAWHSFRHIKCFERYWKTNLESVPRKPSEFQVAMPMYPSHPLDTGIAKWLEDKGIPVYRTAIADHSCERELHLWELPRTYCHAYDLALSMAYRLDTQAILKVQWLTLESLTRELQQLSADLGRLSTARAAATGHQHGSPATNGVIHREICPF